MLGENYCVKVDQRSLYSCFANMEICNIFDETQVALDLSRYAYKWRKHNEI